MRIRDAALIAAATLSHRYITDRFLPDKAIDLMDEAGARLRVEIDSKPAPLDEIERRRRQMEIEREALRKEDDSGSRDRLEALEEELSALVAEHERLKARWDEEVRHVRGIQELKRQIEEARTDAERAERDGELARAAELRYGVVPEREAELETSRQRLEELNGDGNAMLKEEVDAEDVAAVVWRWTGIPVSKLIEGEIDKLLEMESRLHQRVVGQEPAVRAVSDSIRRARAGLQERGRPYGSFMFLGPTGVGKTELAKAPGRVHVRQRRGDDSSRHDGVHGTPCCGAHNRRAAGLRRPRRGGFLTEAVRRRPYSVILLDEIEKAHADVFNILLQILDDGRLTDGKGRTVDFSNSVVIMTSNLGSEHMQRLDEIGPEGIEAAVMDAVRRTFRPEFVNRIDETIVFSPLSVAQLQEIVRIQLRQLRERVADRNLEIEFSEAAEQLLAEQGYDPVYGARPLKRLIRQLVENPLARAILAGEFVDGDHIRVDTDPTTSVLAFRRTRATAAAG